MWFSTKVGGLRIRVGLAHIGSMALGAIAALLVEYALKLG